MLAATPAASTATWDVVESSKPNMYVVVAQAQRAITTRAATRVWWLAPTRGTDLSPTG